MIFSLNKVVGVGPLGGSGTKGLGQGLNRMLIQNIFRKPQKSRDPLQTLFSGQMVFTTLVCYFLTHFSTMTSADLL